MKIYSCPSDPKPLTWRIRSEDSAGTFLAELATTNYIGVFGTEEFHECEERYEVDGPGFQCTGNGTFFHNSYIRLDDLVIADGSANTMIVGERRTTVGSEWYSTWSGVIPGGEESVARILGHADHPPNAAVHVEDFSSWHTGGANFLFGDGHVRFIAENINPTLFAALATRDGGEAVQAP